MVHAVDNVTKPPPEVEVTPPEWSARGDPPPKAFPVSGPVFARGASYRCQVLVAPGGYPGVADFQPVPSPVCDDQPRSKAVDGPVASIDVQALKDRFPPGSVADDFRGRESGSASEQPHSGRPNTLPYGFVVKIVATAAGDREGSDERQLFLHRDRSMLDGFPKQLPGDGEASPLFADLDGDNRNELIVANSDGLVYAFRRDGSQVPGFPVHSDPLPAHGGRS